MGNTIITHFVGTYQEAVKKAHEIWEALESKTAVSVHSDRACLYYWHRISATGVVDDRNNAKFDYPKGYQTVLVGNHYRAVLGG